ncbi:uncharacterized protein B0H64DRAFT_102378 [Chaetomium fimeti]|uniref:Uncharacterized protein n=1 Tax=Chaetomium fimeti TaxID=1854472 RepID=A0AAE0LW40_9PEZI|nr:hypothetical protein B0H64DRAFT_102378 [Chaetomium fimeti]
MPRPNFNKPSSEPQPEPPKRNAPSTPIYSDASSSYWPAGWNFDKFSRATDEDRASLPEGELEKMQAGLRDVLGDRGVGALAMYLYREEQKRAKETGARSEAAPSGSESAKPASTPDWLRNWRRRHRGQKWGFVAFRTVLYGDEEGWDGYKKRLDGIVSMAFEREGGGLEDWEQAKDNFELRWIEDPELAGADAMALRGRYEELGKDLPAGLSQCLFLCASQEAVDSVTSLDEDDLPTLESVRWRPTAPFLLAIAADANLGLEEGHEEREWFKPVFKVAAETIIDELWPLVDSIGMPLRRITRHVKGSSELGPEETADAGEELEDIWWTMAPSPERLKKRRRDIE